MLFTSQVIASASGSAGGLTASRNRYGMYFRARVVPVDPSTIRQQFARAFFRTAAVTWRTLTDVQREGWETYADNTPMQNRLGQTVTLTGFAQFVRTNSASLSIGLGLIDDPPTVFGLPEFTPPAIVSIVGTVLTVSFDVGDTWVSEDGSALTVSISRPVSVSVNFFKGPFQKTGLVLGDATTPPTSPAVLSSNFTYTAGQKGFVSFRMMRADGRYSQILIDAKEAA